MLRLLPIGLSLLLLVGCYQQPNVITHVASPVVKPDASDEFFAADIRHLELSVKPKDAEKINRDNRPYVPCTLIEKDAAGKVLAEYSDVAIKLKGAAGSFQGFQERPAVTVRTDKYVQGQLFHALTKFHLNNSVQDDTYLHEQLCAELFAQAGVPATRVSHARVWLNGRDVGLYVLKEGFDQRFLARHFTHANGNLYDGGFCTDIDTDLEKDMGDGPNDFSDLVALREACQIADPAARWQRLEELVDIDALVSFVAMELMTCHWDGYSRNRNNYRVYFDPGTHKVHLFPHGMDQMFGDPSFSIVDAPEAMLAHSVLENPLWRQRYENRVRELLPLFSPPDKLLARLDALHARLRPTLAVMDENFANEHDQRVRELKDRIIARAQSLEEQKLFPAPKPSEFDERGMLPLTDWRPAAEVDDANLEAVDLVEDKQALRIACGPSGNCIASWRTNVLLSAGKYRFVAKARANEVVALADDRGAGAGVRISGASRENRLEGTTDWTDLNFEFTVDEETRSVELVSELRATAGEVQFELGSMRLVRLP